MRVPYTVVIALAITILSCSKDEEPAPAPIIPQPLRTDSLIAVEYNIYRSGSRLDTVFYREFRYDMQNRLVNLTTQQYFQGFPTNVSTNDFRYHGSDTLPFVAESFNTASRYYWFDADSYVKKDSYAIQGTSDYDVKEYRRLNNGVEIRSSSHNFPTRYDTLIQVVVDGKIIQEKFTGPFSETYKYSYDNNPRPRYLLTPDRLPIQFHLERQFKGNKNNMTRLEQVTSSGGTNVFNMAYTYNTAGLPVQYIQTSNLTGTDQSIFRIIYRARN